MENFNFVEPVAITAYSTIASCGYGKNALFQTLLHNKTTLAPISLFELPFLTQVGEICQRLPSISQSLAVYDCRNAQVALAVLNHPEDAVRIALERAKAVYGVQRIGVVIGTSTSGLYETESAYREFQTLHKMPDDFHFVTQHAYQATARFIQLELGVCGPCFAISTACSSSAKAIAAGQRLIASGVCDAVLVGGVDTLCRLTLRGFKSLDLISEKYCQPMDKDRCGINIGEAGALLVLEKSSQATANQPHVLAVGESSDAHHMSSPHPEGTGAVLAMRKALEQANLTADQVDYLNLHATATRINDQTEAHAVHQVFENLPCSATKGLMGHTLGAAGALEAIICLLALEQQFIPGTANLQRLDEAFPCDIVTEPLMQQNLTIAMSNSFGFGGNNASVILSKKHV